MSSGACPGYNRAMPENFAKAALVALALVVAATGVHAQTVHHKREQRRRLPIEIAHHDGRLARFAFATEIYGVNAARALPSMAPRDFARYTHA